MSEVRVDELIEAGVLSVGDGYRTKRAEHGRPGYRILRVADVQDSHISVDGDDFVRHEFVRAIGPKVSQAGDVLLTTKGTVGRVATFPADLEPVVYSPQLCYFRVHDESKLSSRYLAFWLKSTHFLAQAASMANSTDMAPYISLRDLRSAALQFPDIDEQHAIAEVLGALEDKIAANDRAIAGLDELRRAQYALALSKDADETTLDHIAEFKNRFRVPLSGADRQQRRGPVPYYGAAGRLDYVDEALFNQALVLVGEDGSVRKEGGSPVVQYVWGPSWVNNHAHVLVGSGISTELLRAALERANVDPLITGAVQPKLSMSKLKTLNVQLPRGERLSRLEELLGDQAAFTRAVAEESERLAATRDALLPLLMSGKLRVKDAERVGNVI